MLDDAKPAATQPLDLRDLGAYDPGRNSGLCRPAGHLSPEYAPRRHSLGITQAGGRLLVFGHVTGPRFAAASIVSVNPPRTSQQDTHSQATAGATIQFNNRRRQPRPVVCWAGSVIAFSPLLALAALAIRRGATPRAWAGQSLQRQRARLISIEQLRPSPGGLQVSGHWHPPRNAPRSRAPRRQPDSRRHLAPCWRYPAARGRRASSR